MPRAAVPCKLSDDSLEKLCIAIANLQSAQGLLLAVTPKDILQPWVLEQLPEIVR